MMKRRAFIILGGAAVARGRSWPPRSNQRCH
jgi:hypothetical protein